MNPELQKELVAWLASMRDGLKAGTDFAIEQAPLLVQELLLYSRVTTALIVIGILGALVGSMLLVRYCKAQAKLKPNYDDWRFGAAAAHVIPITLGLCLIVAITECLKVWLAPRVYIVEYLGNLLVK